MSIDTTNTTRSARTPIDDKRLREIVDQEHLDEMRQNRMVEYTSLETNEPVKLTLAIVKQVVATPTKGGNMPSDADCFLFMKLCQARRLNPLVGDAFFVGYDQKTYDANGQVSWKPKFEIIVAHSALLKRAEASGHYNGMESGVIVKNEDGTIEELVGDFYLDSQTLLGAWAKVYRKDREIVEYDRLRLDVFNPERSRWLIDPGGLIVKCAESSVLRRAFPGETAGMYVKEEFDAVVQRGKGRKFEIDDIDDNEDRLKKTKATKKKTTSSEKKKVKKTPEPAKQEPAPEEKQQEELPMVEAPANEEAVLTMPVNDGSGTEDDPWKGEPEAAAEPVTNSEVVSDEGIVEQFKELVNNESMIRKVRTLLQEWSVRGDEAQQQEMAQIASDRETKLREELA